MKKIDAFTLTELMIVILLSSIVILLSYSLLNYTKLLTRTEVKQLDKVQQFADLGYQLEYASLYSDYIRSYGPQDRVDSIQFSMFGNSKTLIFGRNSTLVWNGDHLDGFVLVPKETSVNPLYSGKEYVKDFGFTLHWNDTDIKYFITKNYSSKQFLNSVYGY